MTWASHQTISASLVYLATADTELLVPTLLGSLFPDLIEFTRIGKWEEHHRKGSHWFVMYSLPLIVLLIYGNLTAAKAPYILSFFFVGCLLHIVEDSLSGKVPFMNPRRNVGIRLIRNGSYMELLIALLLAFTAVVYGYINGRH